jgi:hypothetical protein
MPFLPNAPYIAAGCELGGTPIRFHAALVACATSAGAATPGRRKEQDARVSPPPGTDLCLQPNGVAPQLQAYPYSQTLRRKSLSLDVK